jgi:hypothetical protein
MFRCRTFESDKLLYFCHFLRLHFRLVWPISTWSVCKLLVAFFWGGFPTPLCASKFPLLISCWQVGHYSITYCHQPFAIIKSTWSDGEAILSFWCARLSHYCTPQYIFRRCAIPNTIPVFVPSYICTSCPVTTFRWYLTELLVINWSFWVVEQIIYTLDIPSLGGVDFIILFGLRGRLSTDSMNNPVFDFWRVPRPHLLYRWIHTLFLIHSLFEFLF